MHKRNGKGNWKLTEGSVPQTASFSKSASNQPSQTKESPLRLLRQSKGFSQRATAKKLGIEKTKLLRLEKKDWSQISLGELQTLSNLFNIKIEELFALFRDKRPEDIKRASMKKPCFVIDKLEGFKYSSLVNQNERCFIGSLNLAPQKTIPKDKIPRCELLFCLVLEGTLVLNHFSSEYVFKEGDCFTLNDMSACELHNPHQFQELVAVLISFPSFAFS